MSRTGLIHTPGGIFTRMVFRKVSYIQDFDFFVGETLSSDQDLRHITEYRVGVHSENLSCTPGHNTVHNDLRDETKNGPCSASLRISETAHILTGTELSD